EEHSEILLDANARGPRHLAIETDPDVTTDRDDEPGRWWHVRQTLADPDEHHDWVIEAQVDLDATDAVGELVLRSTALRRL
ncbi:MAG TPA: DUF3516 domain-containing protein, partial [Phycicoccus sp.]|nr:DUF3516 domain-containing protein [Phycicoccus sp.]